MRLEMIMGWHLGSQMMSRSSVALLGIKIPAERKLYSVY